MISDDLTVRAKAIAAVEQASSTVASIEAELRDANEERVVAMVAAHDAGVDYGTIGQAAGVSRTTAMGWVKKARRDSLNGSDGRQP